MELMEPPLDPPLHWRMQERMLHLIELEKVCSGYKTKWWPFISG